MAPKPKETSDVMDKVDDSPPSGVFVYITQHEDGTAQVNFQRQGNVDPLAVPVLLEMGARLARDSLGLPNQ